MKTKIFSLTALVLILSTTFTACSQSTGKTINTNNTPSSKSSTTANSSLFNKAGTYPICKETVNLKMLNVQNANVTDYVNNTFTKYLEQKTNAKLEFVILPAADGKQKLSVMINSGDKLPDIINTDLSDIEVQNYGQMGVFIPLNKYFSDQEAAFNLKSWGNKVTDLAGYYTSPDGNIYTLPKFDYQSGNLYSKKAWINQNWLDAVGKPVPTTTDEFYEVLKLFATKDPNKNGKKDEIPLIGNKDGWVSSIPDFLMNSFVYSSPEVDYTYIKGGKVMAAYAQPEWRAGLEYMNKLITEGLFSPLTFTQSASQFNEMYRKEGDAIVGSYAAARPQYVTGDVRQADYSQITPLKGPKGVQYTALHLGNISTPQLYITKDCKNPEAAFRLGDLCYSEEAIMLNRYGVENENWAKTSGVKINEEAKFAFELKNDVWGKQQNVNWQGNAPNVFGDFLIGTTWDGKTMDPKSSNYATLITKKSKDIAKQYVPKETVIRYIYNSQEAAELADIRTNLKTYVEEQRAAFITGARKLNDKEWNDYLKELDNIGVQKMIKLTQAAYDRFLTNSKK